MNHTANLLQSQGTTVLTQIEIAETRELAIAFAETLDNKQLLTQMGMPLTLCQNTAVWSWLNCTML